MQFIRSLFILVFIGFFASTSLAQLDSVFYQGPSQGSVASGVMVNTDNFTNTPISGEPIVIPHPILIVNEDPLDINIDGSDLPEYHYSEDLNTYKKLGSTEQTLLLNSWETDRLTIFIPPDPDVAVGPNHIITTVNVDFSIWDKQGNLIKNINGETWCGQAIANPGAFDPQIVYDHYAGRWFMLWDARSQSTQSSFVIAYSDDDDPNGTWYMYAINASMNGSQSANFWADFPHVGFDSLAIYITSNQFAIAGGAQYSKIRIISKSELYSSDGGSLSWQDLWNIKATTSSGGQNMMGTQPVVSYSGNDIGYFAWAAWFDNSYYTLFKITNPTTAPWLRGKRIFVSYNAPPPANQLGGGTPLENDGAFKNRLTVRDGFLYGAHAIDNTTAPGYSSLKYIKVDISNGTIVEQSEFGASGYFYMYPTITVDKDNNIAVTYSRSADTEYVGGYYSSKYDGDPPGLNGSWPLVEGQGNYDVTFGGSRNRWGDYLGIYLDPFNEYDVWIFPEYAAAQNIWGTYIGQIRMAPYSGVYLFTEASTINFGDLEINSPSVTQTVTISNYGEEDLIINAISSPVGPFTLLNNLTYPDTLHSYDSLNLEIEFNPQSPAIYEEFMAFDDNDANFDGLTLQGVGFEINQAFTGLLYSSTGITESGKVLTISKDTGEGTELGISNFNELSSLTINPITNIMYGIAVQSNQTELVRVNATGGDAFTLHTLNIGNMVGIAFDTLGTLYGAIVNGEIYTIDLTDGSYSLVTTASVQLVAITFDPATNEMWATPRIIVGPTKDRIYTIDLSSGDATLIGETGFDVTTNDLAFDEAGTLFGIIGGGTDIGELITISTSDGIGTSVGAIGFQNVVGLAYTVTGNPLGIESDEVLPEEYALEQNYPNPFNPTTRIEFSLPINADVQLVVYNILGEQVTTLLNTDVSAGRHSVTWNATDASGRKLTSGVYLYKLQANGKDGSVFQEIRKMLLLK